MTVCPDCRAKESQRFKNKNTVTIFYECGFSATFEIGLTEEEMQKRLYDFKVSGKMDEWSKKPLF